MTKFKKIIDILLKTYPDAHCELNHSTAYELLVATVLSAQSTDARVNIITKQLFEKYNTPHKMIELGEEKLSDYIRSIGFYNVKSKNIIMLSKLIIYDFNGQVPDNMDDLIKLPGVGRKTANVVLSNWFNVQAIAVDTHVLRLSKRLGFTDNDNPLLVEIDLMNKIEKKYWTAAHHCFIFHGRKICKARNPECNFCKLKNYCDYYTNINEGEVCK